MWSRYHKLCLSPLVCLEQLSRESCNGLPVHQVMVGHFMHKEMGKSLYAVSCSEVHAPQYYEGYVPRALKNTLGKKQTQRFVELSWRHAEL